MKWSILARFSDFFDESFRLPSRLGMSSKADPERVCQAIAKRSVLAERGVLTHGAFGFQRTKMTRHNPSIFRPDRLLPVNTGQIQEW
jgi:hypothetical protein